MTLYIEEFLWRGRPAGSKQETAYHVIIGQVDEDGFGRERITLSDPMTPDQAEALGFPLSAIVAEINAGALAERDAALAAKEAADRARNEADEAKAAALAERDEAVAARDLAVAEKEAVEAELLSRGEI